MIRLPLDRIYGRLGDSRVNKYGTVITIVDFLGGNNITVQFDDEYSTEITTTFRAFDTNVMASPYDKTVKGVGYLGLGSHYNRKDGVVNKLAHRTWLNMIKRCYSVNEKGVSPRYLDCSISEDWLNYQNFAQWYEDNYYEIEDCPMNLDKDILIKGNKIYSSETCVFVPDFINSTFTKTNSKRGDLPIGVTRRGKVFRAGCCIGKKKIDYLGQFATPIDAFDAYKECKETYIKKIAMENQDYIPIKLYLALVNYKVEITD